MEKFKKEQNTEDLMNKSLKKSIQKSEATNKFNVRRLEPGFLKEVEEKIMKKTLDVSMANEENSHHNNNGKKEKDNWEDSNEILEEIELNNIADDNKDADNAILDFKNSDFLKKEPEKVENALTFGFKHEISLKRSEKKDYNNNIAGTPQKVHEMESITIEIRSKKENIENKEKANSILLSPPSISSSKTMICLKINRNLLRWRGIQFENVEIWGVQCEILHGIRRWCLNSQYWAT